jgi:hypothetical protein
MFDRFLWGAMNAAVVTLITSLAAGSLVCAHSGVLNLCAGLHQTGIGLLLAAAGLAGAAGLLIKNRNDLVDR